MNQYSAYLKKFYQKYIFSSHQNNKNAGVISQIMNLSKAPEIKKYFFSKTNLM